jgi:hypothetical protein
MLSQKRLLHSFRRRQFLLFIKLSVGLPVEYGSLFFVTMSLSLVLSQYDGQSAP